MTRRRAISIASQPALRQRNPNERRVKMTGKFSTIANLILGCIPMAAISFAAMLDLAKLV
jgi:hypothetical protein